jgi:hypothetical protein
LRLLAYDIIHELEDGISNGLFVVEPNNTYQQQRFKPCRTDNAFISRGKEGRVSTLVYEQVGPWYALGTPHLASQFFPKVGP